MTLAELKVKFEHACSKLVADIMFGKDMLAKWKTFFDQFPEFEGYEKGWTQSKTLALP